MIMQLYNCDTAIFMFTVVRMSNEIYKLYKKNIFFSAAFCKREFLVLNLHKGDECKVEHVFHLKS